MGGRSAAADDAQPGTLLDGGGGRGPRIAGRERHASLARGVGLRDLRDGVIRCIGDPDVRFREDPVRMLRAVVFAARLGFTIDPAVLGAILLGVSMLVILAAGLAMRQQRI